MKYNIKVVTRGIIVMLNTGTPPQSQR